MKTLIKLLAIGILLGSCSAQGHLRRALIKDPDILKADTITISRTDTVITESVRIDTAVSVIHDTIRVENERIRLEIVRIPNELSLEDSLAIQAECKPDTLVIPGEDKIITNNVLRPMTNFQAASQVWWMFLLLLLVTFMAIIFLLKR